MIWISFYLRIDSAVDFVFYSQTHSFSFAVLHFLSFFHPFPSLLFYNRSHPSVATPSSLSPFFLFLLTPVIFLYHPYSSLAFPVSSSLSLSLSFCLSFSPPPLPFLSFERLGLRWVRGTAVSALPLKPRALMCREWGLSPGQHTHTHRGMEDLQGGYKGIPFCLLLCSSSLPFPVLSFFIPSRALISGV